VKFNFNNKNYFRAVAFMLILTTFLPVVYKNLPSIFHSHDLYAAIWLASVLFLYPRIFKQKSVLYFLLYGLVFIVLCFNTIWSEIDDWNKKMIIHEYYVFTVALSVFFYFISEKDYEGLAWLTRWSIIFMGITAIMTIYSTTIDPLYVRKTTAGDLQTLEKFGKLGGGAYGYISALVPLFPIMIYYYQKKSISIFSRKLIIFFIVIFFIALIRAQIFTNILLSFFVIIVSLLGRKKMSQSLIIISVFLIIIYMIPTAIYADILVSISSYFDPKSETYSKLNDMAEFITVGNSYATGIGERADRWPLLIKAFVENPILGYASGYENKNIGAGGHLYWMNKLTIIGILGFIPFLIIHYNFIKTALKLFNKNNEFTFYFLLSIFSVIALGLMKNLAGRELWFTYFIVLPGMYFLPLLKKKHKHSIKL